MTFSPSLPDNLNEGLPLTIRGTSSPEATEEVDRRYVVGLDTVKVWGALSPVAQISPSSLR